MSGQLHISLQHVALLAINGPVPSHATSLEDRISPTGAEIPMSCKDLTATQDARDPFY